MARCSLQPGGADSHRLIVTTQGRYVNLGQSHTLRPLLARSHTDYPCLQPICVLNFLLSLHHAHESRGRGTAAAHRWKLERCALVRAGACRLGLDARLLLCIRSCVVIMVGNSHLQYPRGNARWEWGFKGRGPLSEGRATVGSAHNHEAHTLLIAFKTACLQHLGGVKLKGGKAIRKFESPIATPRF